MILPGNEIARLCVESYPPMIDPFRDRTREKGVTFGLSSAGYDVRIAEELWLDDSKRFALASTVEKFCMPLDVLGIVHDKSTWARIGIAVQNTVIEPGWRGYLTLEITSHNRGQVHFARGMGIAQIVFHKLLYATTSYEGKYQDQPSGPQSAIMEDDK